MRRTVGAILLCGAVVLSIGAPAIAAPKVMTDDELDMVRPELEHYLREVEKLRELDLADVLSGRLLRAQEGGTP
jgi:hypothetical protein